MSDNQKKITAGFLLLDANDKLLKNIEYKVVTVKDDKESHLVKGKTNSKGATYEFVKPKNTNICLYVKIGTKGFQKVACLLLPPTKKSKLKIRARVSAILIDSKLEKHGESPGSIKRKDYQVVRGDTLENIAKKFNTDIAQLKSLNPKIKSIHKVYEGDWLKVPAQIGDASKETTDNSPPKPKPTKPATVDSKNDSDQPWYEEVWDSVKETADESDAMIDKVEEAIKQGQQKVIDETIDVMESVADASEKLYDTLFDDKEDTTSSDINPSNNKSKIDESQLDIKQEAGTNQKGNPAEQFTYDNDTTVYHIYYDGRIERANKQAVGYAAFFYYDEKNNKHDLGKSAYIKGQRWIRKNEKDGNNRVYLVDIRDFLSYKKGNVQYKIHENSEGGKRYYLTGVTLAAYLGTLCKLGYIDISFNGFSDANGGPGVSSSHVNGEVGDMRYLRKDFKALAVTVFDKTYSHERSLKLVETLYIFGFGRTRNNYTERYSKPDLGLSNYTLPHCEHKKFQLNNSTWVRHHHHLHLQGLKSNLKDIDVISKVPEKNEKNSFLAKCIPLYSGEKLNASDYQNAAKILGCEVAAIKAVAKAETKADAFRQHKGNTFPSILFEAHKFRLHTDSKFDNSHPHLSAEYGKFKYGLHSAQYKKLEEAIDLDLSAALKACSWGKFQILGSNFEASGFSDVQSMVKEMFKSEKEHLEAFVNFVSAHPTMKKALQNKHWKTFASNYNGPDYKRNEYDTKMSNYYIEFKNNSSKLP